MADAESLREPGSMLAGYAGKVRALHGVSDRPIVSWNGPLHCDTCHSIDPLQCGPHCADVAPESTEMVE